MELPNSLSMKIDLDDKSWNKAIKKAKKVVAQVKKANTALDMLQARVCTLQKTLEEFQAISSLAVTIERKE